jgi:tetratricopeptide (TPR) repeat protein
MMVRRHLALAVLIAATPTVAIAQTPSLEQATRHLAEGTLSGAERAVELFRAAIALDSTDPRTYLGLAEAYRQLVWDHGADWVLMDSAYGAARQATLHDPLFTEAYAWLAERYRAERNHSMARLRLSEAVTSNPDSPLLLTLLGRNYFDTGDCGMARPYLERAMELGPVPLTYRFLGWCSFYLRQPERQQQYFHRYLELEPDDTQGMGGLVWSYTMQGRYDEAIAIAERFLEEKRGIPYYSWIVANAAEVHLFAGNEVRARELYEHALGIDSTAINQFAARAATTTLGYLYWKGGRRSEAERLFRQTLERRRGNLDWVEERNGLPIPERWEFAYDIASVYAAQGDRDRAYQWLFRAVMAGYPAHNAFEDPVMSGLYDDPAYRLLVRQARLRVEATWNAAGGI